MFKIITFLSLALLFSSSISKAEAIFPSVLDMSIDVENNSTSLQENKVKSLEQFFKLLVLEYSIREEHLFKAEKLRRIAE